MTATSEALEQGQHLTFSLAGEEFGIDILRVKEIIEYAKPTGVPMMPGSVRGVINVRGSVVPVVDLAIRFGAPVGEITKRTCIVIVEVAIEGEETVMGIVADAVNEVTYLGPQDIEPAPSFGTNVSTEFLRGIGKVGEKFVLMLNVDEVLSPEELDAVVEVQEAELEGSAGDGDATDKKDDDVTDNKDNDETEKKE